MEKINIVVSLILICFILILSIEKSKRTIENFYTDTMNSN